MKRTVLLLALASFSSASAQTSRIFPKEWFHRIREEASGERPLADFRYIHANFSGFTPSRGGDDMARYLAERLREHGLSDVVVESFPSDGKTFFWTFLGEPAWEAESGTLDLVAPVNERLADFAADRIVLGRFSTSADVTAELVDVGEGTSADDYEGKDVREKVVLASGNADDAHREAVWGRGARGVVSFRMRERPDEKLWINNPTLGNRTGVRGLVPWEGPNGEPPGFLFSLTEVDGLRLRSMLARGETVRVRAQVRATTAPGHYQQASGVIPGRDPAAQQVWIKAHTNHRNTGGGNNLTGVGATLEVARVLHRLIENRVLPRPRRSIRFLYSAEHFVSTYELFQHPERRERVLAFFSVDMTGFDAEKVDGYFRMYRLPHSMSHFLSDAAAEIVDAVGRANTISSRPGSYDPIFAPTGSRDPMYYRVEDFWAPSDHEEMVEGSIGIPALEFGHPDRFIGTQEDSLDKVDPTQMRRSVLTIAAAAYYLASLDAASAGELLPVMVENAGRRIASEWGRALGLLETHPRDAWNVLAQARAREMAALRSLRGIADDDAIARWSAQVDAIARSYENALGAAPPAPTEAEHALSRLVPKRNDAICGPVNVFRPEYGSIWIARKTGNPDVLGEVPLTRRGRFVAYEALNFADGTRTLLEIRDAVSAEYVPVPADEIESYFRFLERLEVLTLVDRE